MRSNASLAGRGWVHLPVSGPNKERDPRRRLQRLRGVGGGVLLPSRDASGPALTVNVRA